MGNLGKLIFVTLFFGVSAWVQANTTEKIFLQAKVIEQSSKQDRQYHLPLGRVKFDRSVGRDVPSRVKKLDGEFGFVLWELTGDVSLPEAQKQVESHLADARFEQQFFCRGRDCGESFAWANAIFQQPNLYGNDRNQTLWVTKDKGAQRYHVFYLVERPNRRIYFYEETLFVPDLVLDASLVKDMLTHQGYIIVGEVVIEGKQPVLTKVVDKLMPYAGSVSASQLVVHRHGLALEVDIEGPLKTALKQAGLDFSVTDVRNMAPREDAPGIAWVEWVDPDWKP